MKFSDAEIDVLLEKYDQTAPELQRRVVAELTFSVMTLERALSMAVSVSNRRVAAMQLVLLFHGCGPWGANALREWRDLQVAAGVKVVRDEATTKDLCDILREILRAA